MTVSVVPARDVDLDQLDLYYGLFRSPKAGKARLDELARAHRLCHRLLGLEARGPGPCFAYQLRQCSGACVGADAPEDYNHRLLHALADYQIAVWPYAGPVWLEERGELKTDYHLIDQ